MTTKVIVRSPRHNHLDVSVETIRTSPGQPDVVTCTTHIPDGEERSFYVYNTQDLRIKEAPKQKS